MFPLTKQSVPHKIEFEGKKYDLQDMFGRGWAYTLGMPEFKRNRVRHSSVTLELPGGPYRPSPDELWEAAESQGAVETDMDYPDHLLPWNRKPAMCHSCGREQEVNSGPCACGSLHFHTTSMPTCAMCVSEQGTLQPK